LNTAGDKKVSYQIADLGPRFKISLLSVLVALVLEFD